VLVSWTVDVITVVDSPILLVRVIVLSKTEVETPVRVDVAGAEVMLTFKPPVGTTFVEVLWSNHSDQVLFALGALAVVSPDTSVALVVAPADQVLFPPSEVVSPAVVVDALDSIAAVVVEASVLVVATADSEDVVLEASVVPEVSEDLVRSRGVEEDTSVVVVVLPSSEVVVVMELEDFVRSRTAEDEASAALVLVHADQVLFSALEVVVVELEDLVRSSTDEEDASVVVAASVVCAVVTSEEVVSATELVAVVSDADVVASTVVFATPELVLGHGPQVSLFCSINGLAWHRANEAARTAKDLKCILQW